MDLKDIISKENSLELYRAIIPENHIINDNHGQHYRVHMGNLEWLTDQFNSIKNGYYEKTVGRGRGAHKERFDYSGPGGFKIPDIKIVKSYIEKINERQVYLNNDIKDNVTLICEIWKITNRRFDPQNYCKTFKAPIDLLVHNGYIDDDSWKYINGITYVGGGPEKWYRHMYGENLPEDLNIDWWNENATSNNDLLIRILVAPKII